MKLKQNEILVNIGNETYILIKKEKIDLIKKGLILIHNQIEKQKKEIKNGNSN